MHFKEGHNAHVAKCVPNKWYPSQNGSSLEVVLANGSKSMGLCQHPSSIRAGTHSGGTNGPCWLGSSKGLWLRARRLLGEFSITSCVERWKPSWVRITMRPVRRKQKWWKRNLRQFYLILTSGEGVSSSLYKSKKGPTGSTSPAFAIYITSQMFGHIFSLNSVTKCV